MKAPQNSSIRSGTVQCRIETPATDPQNDDLTHGFIWFNNGEPIEDEVLFSSQDGHFDTLDVSTLNPLDTLQCIGYASDGFGLSEAAYSESIVLCGYSDCDTHFMGIDLVTVPSGTFVFGNPDGSNGVYQFEIDDTEMTLSHEFEMATTPITNSNWETVQGQVYTGAYPLFPKTEVSWDEMAYFTNTLSGLSGHTVCYDCVQSGGNVSCHLSSSLISIYECTGWRLPTEVEWEHAAKAGQNMQFWTPSGGGNISTSMIGINSVNETATISCETSDPFFYLTDGTSLLELGYFVEMWMEMSIPMWRLFKRTVLGCTICMGWFMNSPMMPIKQETIS